MFGKRSLDGSARGKLLSTLTLALLLALAPQVAHGTPPEEVHFQLDLVYGIGNYTGEGVWLSSGILLASGHATQPVRHAGYDETGSWIRNVHTTATLCPGAVSDCEGAEDTITIRSHLTNLDFVFLGTSTGDGRWVITDATGAYEGLHGEGAAYVSLIFHPVCPDPSVAGLCLTQTLTLEGEGHFEP